MIRFINNFEFFCNLIMIYVGSEIPVNLTIFMLKILPFLHHLLQNLNICECHSILWTVTNNIRSPKRGRLGKEIPYLHLTHMKKSMLKLHFHCQSLHKTQFTLLSYTIQEIFYQGFHDSCKWCIPKKLQNIWKWWKWSSIFHFLNTCFKLAGKS